jgi:hypothetical protein
MMMQTIQTQASSSLFTYVKINVLGIRKFKSCLPDIFHSTEW